MFSQLMFVRLRAAEKALREGRLDEAYRLASAPDLRDERRAKAVLESLTPALLDRARAHFDADRFLEALEDVNRAELGGARKQEVAQLREHIQTVMTEQKKYDARRKGRLDAARKRADAGSLAAGRRIIEQATIVDDDARALQQDFARRADEVADVLARAKDLLDQGQYAAAAQRIMRARSIDASSAELARLEGTLCERVFDATQAAFTEGRLSRACDELACLGALGAGLPRKGELIAVLDTARETGHLARAGDYDEALRAVMKLSRLAPGAKWVKEATKQLEQLDTVRPALLAGPLGERIDIRAEGQTAPPAAAVARASPPAGAVDRASPPAKRPRIDETIALPHRPTATNDSPSEGLLLLVDGGGSYLILRSTPVAIGRVVAGRRADVPIFSDLAENHATITRVEEDYFVMSGHDLEVGGHRTKHQLLRDGDRVVLGRKAKFTFRLPSRTSASATLDLSDTTKMPNDVRRVVLFDKHATIGAGPGAHIGCRHAHPPLVMYERGGSLWIRRKNDGHVNTEAVELRPGKPVEVGGVSLVLSPWRVRAAGGSTA